MLSPLKTPQRKSFMIYQGKAAPQTPAGKTTNISLSPPRIVRLQDIAEKAQVSRATVSLALRGHPSISTDTRSRIQKIATVLEYRPNPMVSALMKYQRVVRTHRKMDVTLAIILPSKTLDSHTGRMLQAFLDAIRSEAHQCGYRIEEFWLEDMGMSLTRLNQILYHRAIPGVIIAPFVNATEPVLDWSHLCAVAIGSSLKRPRIHRIAADAFEAVHLAISHLRKLGYQRIGLAIKDEGEMGLGKLVGTAYCVEQQNFHGPHRLDPLIASGDSWSLKRFSKWCSEEQPEVVLGHASNILPWLEELGMRVPEHIGFADLSITDFPNWCSGIDNNFSAIGQAAIELLVELVESNQSGIPRSPKTVLLSPAWVDGNTTRCVRDCTNSRL